MAVSHKDWELPNPRILVAEIDAESGLDFPIQTGISTGNVSRWKSRKLKCKNIRLFSFNNIYLWQCQKVW